MENISIILAIVGSGLLSTIIIMINDWVKDFFITKRQKNKELSETTATIRKEFLRNIDFIYNGDYLNEEELKKKRYNFLKTYRMIFLYLSDQEVKQINAMLDVISVNSVNDDKVMQQRKEEVASSFLIFRKTVVKKTKLTARDFRHII